MIGHWNRSKAAGAIGSGMRAILGLALLATAVAPLVTCADELGVAGLMDFFEELAEYADSAMVACMLVVFMAALPALGGYLVLTVTWPIAKSLVRRFRRRKRLTG